MISIDCTEVLSSYSPRAYKRQDTSDQSGVSGAGLLQNFAIESQGLLIEDSGVL